MTSSRIQSKNRKSNIVTAVLRGIKLGLVNFWRNKFLSIATILVIAVIIFIFNIILTVHFIVNQGLQSLSKQVDLVIDLRSDIELYDVQTLIKAVKTIDGVRNVEYRSKDEALEIVAKTHPETVELYRKFNLKNPLPPSIIITPEKPEVYKKVENFLKHPQYKNFLKNSEVSISSSENEILASVNKNLNSINNFVRQIIFWIILAFVSGGTLVIVNAIQLTIYTRRNEIYIMRLVGATPNFIRLPFLFEGILYSIFAVGLSFIFLIILSKTIQIEDSNFWNYYSNIELQKVFLAEFTVTMTLGIMSSFSAVQQYIKGKLTVN